MPLFWQAYRLNKEFFDHFENDLGVKIKTVTSSEIEKTKKSS